MSSSDKELEKQIAEAGKKLLYQPHSSLNQLLPLLDEMVSSLARVEQTPPKFMDDALFPLVSTLTAKVLLMHSDADVKGFVESCLCEISRITAPYAPYNDVKMKGLFQLIVSSFENLLHKNVSSTSPSKCLADVCVPDKKKESSDKKENVSKNALEGSKKAPLVPGSTGDAEAKTTKKPMQLSKNLDVAKRKLPSGKNRETEAAVQYDESLVDSKVKVWWPYEHEFYEGVITHFDVVKKKHTVLYYDGDEEFLDLKKERWEFVRDDETSANVENPDVLQNKKKARTIAESSAKNEKVEASPKSKTEAKSTKSGLESKDVGKVELNLKEGGTPKTYGRTKDVADSNSKAQFRKSTAKPVDDTGKTSARVVLTSQGIAEVSSDRVVEQPCSLTIRISDKLRQGDHGIDTITPGDYDNDKVTPQNNGADGVAHTNQKEACPCRDKGMSCTIYGDGQSSNLSLTSANKERMVEHLRLELKDIHATQKKLATKASTILDLIADLQRRE